MTSFPDSMWRSPARLIHPDHHCSHSHKHGRRDRHRGSERRHDPGRVTQQQDSAKRVKTATSSMSKAMEGDSAGRPSRSSDRSRTVSSSVSVVGRSRSDGGPMPSGTNGSERHRSRSGERGRRDRGHGSERCHESSRFHHSLGIESVGAGPAHVFVGRVQLQVQAGWCDGCPAFYFHSSSASSQSLSSSSRASVGHTSSKATEAETAGRPSRSSDKKKTLSSGVSVVGRSRSDGGPMPPGTNGSERHRLRSGVWGRRGSRVGETSRLTKVPSLATRVPASGPFHREDGTVRGFACSGSRAQGPSEQSENHQTGGQDGWVMSHVRPETPWFQVQHESNVI